MIDIAVPTALPAFIGYTRQRQSSAAAKIESLAQYESIFGGATPGFYLYDSLRLFYANGGATCYVVSAGETTSAISADALLAALAVIQEQDGPTMLVVPDATLLPTITDYGKVVQAMLAQCGTRQDRFAILDVYGGNTVTAPDELQPVVDAFRAAIGDQFLSYGAAYFPFLETDTNVVLPPSGAMAGVYTQVDTTTGVWESPANIVLVSVTQPVYTVTDDEERDLNVPFDGKAIDPIRAFTGRGAVVWGARTLDGNNPDYRYIQVRREIIYIEQSIQRALAGFAFSANDPATWATVTSLVSTFLQSLWAQGGLQGPTAADAFTVACGLATTMTSQDVEDGIMRVTVTLAILRPAEFMELTFEQAMLTE